MTVEELINDPEYARFVSQIVSDLRSHYKGAKLESTSTGLIYICKGPHTIRIKSSALMELYYLSVRSNLSHSFLFNKLTNQIDKEWLNILTGSNNS